MKQISLLWLISSLPVFIVSVQPILRSSVDGYNTVCICERIYFECTVQQEGAETLLTWMSTDYIPGTSIQFARSLNARGDGKLVPLPNGGATLSQLVVRTDQVLEANLIINVFNTSGNAVVMCNDDGASPQSSQRTLVVAGIPQPPILHTVRSYSLPNQIIYVFSLTPPANGNEIDIEFYEINVISFNVTLRLTNDSTSFVIPLPRIGATSTEVSAVSIDRCKQRSTATSTIVNFDDPLLTTTTNGYTLSTCPTQTGDACDHVPATAIIIMFAGLAMITGFL